MILTKEAEVMLIFDGYKPSGAFRNAQICLDALAVDTCKGEVEVYVCESTKIYGTLCELHGSYHSESEGVTKY